MKKQELQGEVAVKETVDKTDFTRILVDQNNTRYDTVLVELREARDKLDAAIEQLTSQKMENLHLRHLLGLGPEDDLPSTRKEMLLRSQDPSDPLNLSPTNGEA